MEPTHLLQLAECYASHVGRGLHTVARRAGAHNRLFHQIKAGRGCHIATFGEVLLWFASNWPLDLEWPPDIPRPTPGKKEAA